MYFDRQQVRGIMRQAMWIAGLVLASRLTRNYAVLVVAAMGVMWAMRRKVGKALVVFMLLSALPMVNPYLMPRYGHFAIMARLTSLIMSFALLASAHTMRPRHRIPLGMLMAFMAVATVSSLGGYAPSISVMKIINFVSFIIAFYIGTQDIDLDPDGVKILKESIMALVLLLVYGSILLRIVAPSAAYVGGWNAIYDAYGVRREFQVQSNSLFCGVTVQSQALGPLLAACFGWVLCDLFCTNPRNKRLHLLALAPIPVLLFMTRSRLSLLTFIVSILAAQRFCLSGRTMAHLRQTVRKMRKYAIVLLAILAVAGVIGEMRNSAISRWMRKTDRLAEDERSLSDALTSSREGLIKQSMADFKKNRMWGMGFQVDKDTATKTAGQGITFSASIEKGVLPTMILGETGIIGAFVFVAFLLVFFSVCIRKRYKATAALFCVMLASNMGEATFFSPSGLGGILWVALVAGGFVIDMGVRISESAALAEFNEGPIENGWPCYVPYPDEQEVSDTPQDDFHSEHPIAP